MSRPGTGKGDKKAESKEEAPPPVQVDINKQIADLTNEHRALLLELDKKKSDRNYFQIERDKVKELYDNERQEIEELESKKENLKRKMEENEELHQTELQVYKQKLHHVLYEHKIAQERLKMQADVLLQSKLDDFEQESNGLKDEKQTLKAAIKNKEALFNEESTALKNQHEKNILKQQEEFEKKLKELEQKYEEKLQQLRDYLDLRKKKELQEMEERKNSHIRQLVEKHMDSFEEIRKYYTKITTHNLQIIQKLKNEVSNMRKNEQNNEKLMFEIAHENNKLSNPLFVVEKEREALQKELQNYQKDREMLKNNRTRLNLTEEKIKNLQGDHRKLIEALKNIEKERNNLYDIYEITLKEITEKSRMKQLLLDKQVMGLETDIKKKDIILQKMNI